VPASSANLGPGFDVLAAALTLHLEVEVSETGSFAVRTELAVPADRENLVVQGFEALGPADAFEFRIASQIPLCGGLGSSAAATIAGLLAADAAFGLGVDVAALATEFEGHPDNVGASLHGGFVICDGSSVRRFDAPDGLEPVLVVPTEPVSTTLARTALASSVPLDDARFNVAAVAQLILGLASGDLDLVACGLRDRLHQPYRARLYPRSARLLEQLPALGALGALGGTISGAGPTVLVWARTGSIDRLLDALVELTGDWARVIPARFEQAGASVSEL
jgi:homoserine kinase